MPHGIASPPFNIEPQVASQDIGEVVNRTAKQANSKGKKIWIDLDNSPHVPFFLPILDELRERGFEILLTARDSYQVCELLKFHNLSCKVLGRHWGKNRLMKLLGTCLRALQFMPLILKEKPDLAVSHGSRAQTMCSLALGLPCITIFDYEFSSRIPKPDWVFIPNLIPDSVPIRARNKVMRYPGLKEDVYIQRLKPDPSVKDKLGLEKTDLVVTVRPPAIEAHYHNPEGEVLLKATLNFLTQQPDVRVILLPRNDRQDEALRKDWAPWIANRKIVIPEHVVDGLNLIWYSDLVVSGGGTMNREAAALGVPVYSIFRGRIGAVDKYLAATNRLVMIERAEDVQTKILLKRRTQSKRESLDHSESLQCIVEGIISLAEHQCLPAHR
jgi:predicted glycosyltransferase